MALENFIQNIAQSIQPNAKEIEQGKKIMDTLFRWFQDSKLFKIDRCELVGSTAKKTFIDGHVDFDCVIFVNEETHRQVQLKDVVGDFQDLLLVHTDLQENDIKLTPHRDPKTLQFEYKHVDFDIGVAINEATNHKNGSPAHKQQANYLMQQFRNGKYSSAEIYRLSSGLSKMAVDFLKKQSSFAHEIARLGKYWNKTLLMELKINGRSYVSGRSSIMELIAVDAAKQEESNSIGSVSYLNAFRIFLQKVRDIKSAKIEFHKGMECEISKVSPYIIDPANPYHNYLEGVKSDILDAFSEFAKLTLARIKQIEKEEIQNRIPSYEKIFETQPTWFESGIPAMKPHNWLVGTVACNSDYVDLKCNESCNEIVNSKDIELMKAYLGKLVQRVKVTAAAIRKSKEVKVEIAQFKEQVKVTAAAIPMSKEVEIETAMFKEQVQKAIDEEINECKSSSSSWTSSNDSHDGRMTTITIPFCNGSNKAVRVSCDWQC